MKKELFTLVTFLAFISFFWWVGYLITGNYEGSRDFAIATVAYSALYRSLRLENKHKDSL